MQCTNSIRLHLVEKTYYICAQPLYADIELHRVVLFEYDRAIDYLDHFVEKLQQLGLSAGIPILA